MLCNKAPIFLYYYRTVIYSHVQCLLIFLYRLFLPICLLCMPFTMDPRDSAILEIGSTMQPYCWPKVSYNISNVIILSMRWSKNVVILSIFRNIKQDFLGTPLFLQYWKYTQSRLIGYRYRSNIFTKNHALAFELECIVHVYHVIMTIIIAKKKYCNIE